MVSLPTSEKLIETGIDTLERAIVYSATLLKACYTKANNQSRIDQTIKISHKIGNNNQATILIEASLNFDNIKALQNGGLILDFLEVKNDIELLETNYYCGISPVQQPEIPYNLPVVLDSLEQYFYYNCALLKASLPSENKSIEISFLEDTSTGGKAKLTLSLPFNYFKWLTSSNYTCSVSRMTESYVNLLDVRNIFDIPDDNSDNDSGTSPAF